MKFADWLVRELVSRGMYKETIFHFDIPNSSHNVKYDIYKEPNIKNTFF